MKIFATLLLESILFFALLIMILGNNDIISIKCVLTNNIYNIPYPYIIIAAWLIGQISMFLMQNIIIKTKDGQKLSAYKKQYEKTSVTYEEKENTIKALENKVKTLETALENYIKKNN